MAVIQAKDIVISIDGQVMTCLSSGTFNFSTNTSEAPACRGVAGATVNRAIDSLDHNLDLGGQQDPDGTFGYEELVAAYQAQQLVTATFGDAVTDHTVYTLPDMIISSGALGSPDTGGADYNFNLLSSGTAFTSAVN